MKIIIPLLAAIISLSGCMVYQKTASWQVHNKTSESEIMELYFALEQPIRYFFVPFVGFLYNKKKDAYETVFNAGTAEDMRIIRVDYKLFCQGALLIKDSVNDSNLLAEAAIYQTRLNRKYPIPRSKLDSLEQIDLNLVLTYINKNHDTVEASFENLHLKKTTIKDFSSFF